MTTHDLATDARSAAGQSTLCDIAARRGALRTRALKGSATSCIVVHSEHSAASLAVDAVTKVRRVPTENGGRAGHLAGFRSDSGILGIARLPDGLAPLPPSQRAQR